MSQITYFQEPSLLTRRQQNSSYLQQLDLPSLPPLSQMLTDRAVTSAVATVQEPQPSKITTASAVVPNVTLVQPPQPVLFDCTVPPASVVGPAAVPVASNLFAPTSTTALVNQPFLPLDTFSGLTTDPATAAAMAAAAVAAGPTYGDTIYPKRDRHPSESSTSSTDKIYSFVAIPGTNHKKRPRRRYDEIERLYHCNWPGCYKSYGTLNHLNAHVSMQKHGPKRHPSEFKEMRKEWRRQKKEREAAKKAAEQQRKRQQEQAAAEAATAMGLAPLPPQPLPQPQPQQPSAPAPAPAPASQVSATTAGSFHTQPQPFHQAYTQFHPTMALSGYY